MTTLITILLILGLFSITYKREDGTQVSFGLSVVCNIIVLILLWMKIF